MDTNIPPPKKLQWDIPPEVSLELRWAQRGTQREREAGRCGIVWRRAAWTYIGRPSVEGAGWGGQTSGGPEIVQRTLLPTAPCILGQHIELQWGGEDRQWDRAGKQWLVWMSWAKDMDCYRLF